MNDIKIIDLHTHTDNSPDGNHSATYMAEIAEQNGIHTVAFTDHCEVDYFYKDEYDRRTIGRLPLRVINGQQSKFNDNRGMPS